MQQQELRSQLTDARTDNQISLTNQLARILTEINLKRIQADQNQSESLKKSSRSQYFYVCFTGLPTLPQQYEHLDLPGQKIIIYPQGFGPSQTADQTSQRLELACIEKQAERVHSQLKNIKNKLLVFLFHSFGTTIMSTLLKFYGKEYEQRLIGMIAIGPYPITSTVGLKYHIEYAENLSMNYLLEHIDELYEVHLERHKNMKIPGYPNKYSNIAVEIAFGKGVGVAQTLRYNRMWPSLLKCFIYGREENRIDQPNINETAIYYCHRRKFKSEYETKVKDILKRRGVNTDNIQERFIFDLQGGKHSVHVQKKHINTVKKIINDYLSVLEEIHS